MIDDAGNVHMVYVQNCVTDAPGDNVYSYYPIVAGVVYWKEGWGTVSAQTIPNPDSVFLDSAINPSLYYVMDFVAPDVDNDGVIEITDTFGVLGSPSYDHPYISMDSAGNVYIVVMGLSEQHIVASNTYYHVFAVKTCTGDTPFSAPVWITYPYSDPDLNLECTYPYLTQRVFGDKLHIMYLCDPYPGVYLFDNTVPDELSDVNVLTLDTSLTGFAYETDGYVTVTLWGIGRDTFIWDFGDGTILTGQKVTYTYTTLTGDTVMPIKLITKSACGQMDTVVRQVNLRCGTVTADFTYATSELTVVFVNQSTDAASFVWYFGDGNTSTVASPTHVYSQPGTYTVCLEAIGWCGDRDTLCVDIRVQPSGVGNVEENTAFQVYPNPSRKDMGLQVYNYGGITRIRIYTLDGRLLIDKKGCGCAVEYVDLGGLMAGAYVLEVEDLEGYVTRMRIVVE